MVQDLSGPFKTTTPDSPSPLQALSAMMTTVPSNVDYPLFYVPDGQPFKLLTDSAARKHLQSMSALLGLSRSLIFHDFCMVGPLGTLEGVYLFKISRPKEPVPPIVFEVYHIAPFSYFPSVSCLQVSPPCLTSSLYLYWVFGDL